MRWLVAASLVLFVTACNPFGKAVYVIVSSDSGSPVSNATVTFNWTTNEPWGPSLRSGDPHSTTVATDSSGVASARVTTDHYVRIEVTHPLHYPATATIVDYALSEHTSGKTALAIQLKRISDHSSSSTSPSK